MSRELDDAAIALPEKDTKRKRSAAITFSEVDNKRRRSGHAE